MVDNTLQHVIYGNAVIANKATDAADVLAITGELNPETAKRLVDHMPLSPLPLDQIQQSQAVALMQMNGSGDLVLGRSHFQNRDQKQPIQQLIVIPHTLGEPIIDLDHLLPLLKDPLPTYNVINAPLEPLEFTKTLAQYNDRKVTIIKSVLDDLLEGDFKLLLGLLSLAISNSIIICNFPVNGAQRLALARVIRLLVPQSVRHWLTFTTHTDTLGDILPRITFSNATGETDIPRLDWKNPAFDDAVYSHPYSQQLLDSWTDDVIELVNLMHRFEEIAIHHLDETSTLEQVLHAVAHRHRLDQLAMRGVESDLDDMLDVLKSSVPMSVELQTAYMILMLENNFQTRDPEIAQFIGNILDNDLNLNKSLQPFFATAIEEQPDAVYSFVRSHLNTIDDDIDEQWLKRLHDSASESVKVAIGSASAETIRSWLMLISREPLRYELSDILQNAMTAAQPYVAESPDLAQDLLTVAIKRQPDMIESLLQDADLLNALPETLTSAIIEHNPSAIEALGSDQRDLFLLGLHRAIDLDTPTVTAGMVRELWQIHTQQQTNTLPPQFRPLSLIERLLAQPETFINGAYSYLMTLSLVDGDQDAVFYDLVEPLSTQANFTESLAKSLQQSNRSIESLLQIFAKILAENLLPAQTVVDTISTLIVNLGFDDKTLPLVEHLSRVMTQHPDTNTTTGVLWKLSELSAVHKNEQMLKVSMRRLLESTRALPSEVQIVDSIVNIRKDTQWSATGRAVLIRWWRAYAREQATGQLQKIDKAMESNRNLEDLRAIVQTTIAMRRILGNRTLEEFSEAVATTYNLLQALSEGFDASDKLVDSMTIRREIDARDDELPAELRPVLSTNLKELAQLVTTLSENRSKPSILRGDDSIERQLVTGEQNPQSAIDVLRWLSGYLDGIQKDETDTQ